MTGLKIQMPSLVWKSYLFFKKNETLNDLLGTTMLLRTVDTEMRHSSYWNVEKWPKRCQETRPLGEPFLLSPITESFRAKIIPLPNMERRGARPEMSHGRPTHLASIQKNQHIISHCDKIILRSFVQKHLKTSLQISSSIWIVIRSIWLVPNSRVQSLILGSDYKQFPFYYENERNTRSFSPLLWGVYNGYMRCVMQEWLCSSTEIFLHQKHK